MPMEFLAGTGAGFRLCWTSCHSGMDLGLHALPHGPFGHPQLVVRLEIEPDLRRSPAPVLKRTDTPQPLPHAEVRGGQHQLHERGPLSNVSSSVSLAPVAAWFRRRVHL